MFCSVLTLCFTDLATEGTSWFVLELVLLELELCYPCVCLPFTGDIALGLVKNMDLALG